MQKDIEIDIEKTKERVKKIIHTAMLNKYLFDFWLRVFVFISIFLLYILDKEMMRTLTYQPIWNGITPIHILWAYFMVTMLMHIFPYKHSSMAMHKATKENFTTKDYSKLELFEFIQKQNISAWLVMLVWLSFNAIFGFLYLFDVMDKIDLIMLTIFYFLSDYICILIWCPFQTFFMKNKCCINCRIYDWGHFMMFTPMLFIKDFFSWSLFFTSLIVLIRWEIYYAKHPERFWFGSNEKLQCKNCNEKLCQIKNNVKKSCTKRSLK